MVPAITAPVMVRQMLGGLGLFVDGDSDMGKLFQRMMAGE